jgi:epoxyqueuosine reductase
MPSSISETREAIRSRALSEGFDAVGFAAARDAARAKTRLRDFVAKGRHGDMDWLARDATRRASPSSLWPDARSIVVVGSNYGPARDALATIGERDWATISVYALGDDYHEVMNKRLGLFVGETFGAEVKLFVDTAPIMEKPLAETAGIGWQGKHTNLVSRQFGSWLFLGSLFTTLALAEDDPERDHCGQCRRCLDICPTKAFPAPYELDARRCISYLTIEHKGHIASEFREPIGNRIYGCDDCLAVCPWNKFAETSRHAQFHARAELDQIRLRDLARLDDSAFRRLFQGSPIKRIGRDRFVRNVLIAIGNSAQKALAPEAERLLDDASPLVRAMAVWALSRLLPARDFRGLSALRVRSETDPDVALEWASALSA